MSGTFQIKRSPTLIILVLFVGSSLQLSAQQTLTLHDCLAMALRSNKDIDAAHHTQLKYENERKALKANFFPDISAMAGDFYSTMNDHLSIDIASPIGLTIGEQLHNRFPQLITPYWQRIISNRITNRLAPFNPTINYKIGNVWFANLNLTQPIYMGGKITAGYKMGKLGAQMAALGEELSREQAIVSVHEAYMLLSKAKELKTVALAYDSLLIKLTNDVASAKRNGMVSNNEVMKVQVKKSEAELKVTQASNSIRLARMNLCQAVGLPLDSPIDIVNDENEDVAFFVDHSVTVDRRTEAQLLDMQTRLAEQKVKLEHSAMLPQLGLTAGATMADGIHVIGEKLLNHHLTFNACVMLKVPIFHAGETRHKVLAAKEDLASQRLQQESLNEKMNLDLQQKANEVEEASLELTMRHRSMEQCAENLRMSRKAYSVGYETLSDLLTAQVLWQQAYADWVEAKYQQRIKFVKWQQAAGKLNLY